MGFFNSKPQVDNTVTNLMKQEALEARQREEQRQADIKTGLTSINDQFKGFNDAFYKTRENNILDYYKPQLDTQFDKAKDQLTYAFARAGTLNSTAAADRNADLKTQYDLQNAGLVSNAKSDANNLRASVNNQQQNLISQLNASADANQAANNATAATSQIYQNQPTYSLLGDIFGGLTSGIGNWINANQNASYRQTYFGPTSAGGSGSQRTVG